MGGTIRDRLRGEKSAAFFGRQREMAELESKLTDDTGPAVFFVHGIGGIGKTALLDALERRASDIELVLLRFDCGAIEPTPRGLLHALGERLARELPSPDAAAKALRELGGRVVMAFDDYQNFRLLDAWLRQTFIPALPADVRVLLLGRIAPADGWTLTPGWRGLVHTLLLGPLDDDAVDALLDSEGVPAESGASVRAVARGHPLALRLAAGTDIARRGEAFAQLPTAAHVLPALATRFLEDVGDSRLRLALQSAAVLRRTTRSLLDATFDTDDPDAVMERLSTLPFVTIAHDGLMIHEAVRLALAESLRAVDPRRYDDLRRKAWACLRQEIDTVGRVQLWRYTADILYLVEHPSIREAFFPADIPQQLVEPARPDDESAIVEITERHDGIDGASAILAWWRELPEAFSVVRGAGGEVLAYSILAFAGQVGGPIATGDPLAAAWLEHAGRAGLPADRPVLFSRRFLTRDTGDGPSIERAACFINIKRTYLENPNAARIYTPVHLTDEILGVFRPLGFRVMDDLGVVQDGRRLDTLMLDFGPGGIPRWIARLVDDLYSDGAARDRLDVDNRALLLAGESVPLTRLEFGVMRHLVENEGRVVTRDELLQDVWGQPFGGSNVVDAVIRTLRKKLGEECQAVETVKGHGYRFCGFGSSVAT